MSVSVSAKVQQTDIVSLPLPLCQRDAGVAHLLSGSGLPAALTTLLKQDFHFEYVIGVRYGAAPSRELDKLELNIRLPIIGSVRARNV